MFGYGLMVVAKVDLKEKAAAFHGHGYAPDTRHWAPHWFAFGEFGEPVNPEVVRKEQREAGARGVACNHPGCWCEKARIG